MLTSQARIRADLNTAGYYLEGVAGSVQMGVDGIHGDIFRINAIPGANAPISAIGQLEIFGSALAVDPEVTLQSLTGQLFVVGETGLGLSSSTGAVAVLAATSVGVTGTTTTNITAGTGDLTLQSTAADVHVDGVNTFVSSLAAGGSVFATAGTGELTVGTPTGQTGYFGATLSATQNNVTGDGTIYDIICNTVHSNNGGNYNNATGEYIAPANGVYCFMGTVSFANINVLHNIAAISFISGAATIFGPVINPSTAMAVGGVMTLTFSTLLTLLAGDSVVLALEVDGAALQIDVVGGGFATSFSGFRIA